MTDNALTERLEAAHRRTADALARPVADEAPPTSNTGGKFPRLVLENGEVKEIPARRGWGGDCAFVDWVNFTVHESSFYDNGTPVTDEQVICDVSLNCERIFGFGITQVRDKGLNFYQRSYVLGDGYGFVCHGGQRNTVLVQLSGEGCAAAREGWEIRLQEFLEGAENGRITRIDLAFDDYNGSVFSVEGLSAQFDLGGFNCGGRNPDIEQRGNWRNPNGKGRTIYIGSRENGKFFRCYEKGKQLGDKSSEWVRVETEFKSVDRFIPFDVLTRAGEYLAAAYPCLNCISQHQERILTTQKTVQASYERVKTWLKHQCGAAINLMFEVEQDATKVLDLIRREGKLPRGIKVPDYRNSGEPIHRRERESISTAAFADLSFSM